ncbi:hypothetical protein TWF506_010677 [Arthrobotrys conoides]|uniref:Uncharacterized protein n=1 Tax=Arthrobotrys conoides TaxID=74498 RepID=A0AAN8RVY8_9PEZI
MRSILNAEGKEEEEEEEEESYKGWYRVRPSSLDPDHGLVVGRPKHQWSQTQAGGGGKTRRVERRRDVTGSAPCGHQAATWNRGFGAQRVMRQQVYSESYWKSESLSPMPMRLRVNGSLFSDGTDPNDEPATDIEPAPPAGSGPSTEMPEGGKWRDGVD